MGMPRVWIVYEPPLYAEVLAWVLEGLGSVEVVRQPLASVDVIVFPLDNFGQPQMSLAVLVFFLCLSTLYVVPDTHCRSRS